SPAPLRSSPATTDGWVAPTGPGNRPASLLKRFLHSDNAQSAQPQMVGNDNSLWGHVMAPQAMQAAVQTPNGDATLQQQRSLLPVPYQPGVGMPYQQQGQFPQQQSLTILPQGLPTTALAPGSSDALLIPEQP